MYLDPGFGGMLLQAIVGLVAVGGAIVFSFRRKIKELFTGKKGKKQEVSGVEESNLQEDAIDMLEESSKESE